MIQFLLMAAATSGIVGLLDLLPPVMQQAAAAAAAAAVAILVVWDFFGDYAGKAAILHGVCTECTRLENQLLTLWSEIDESDMEDADARRQCNMLRQGLSDATEPAGKVGVTVDAKLNKACTADTYRVMQERYVT